jgi:hypothetical protein
MLAPNRDNSANLAVADAARVNRPFEWALGESIHALAPKVKEHVLQLPGTIEVYRGRMRVWRDGGWRGKVASLLLRAAVFADFLFPETEDEVEFELKHVVTAHDDGSLSMAWARTYQFSDVKRTFLAMMRFHEQNGQIINWHGCAGLLEVELVPYVEGDAIVVISRREWLRLGGFRIPLPDFLKGRPLVREWQEPNGELHIRVEIFNTLLGRIFGYEGVYSRVS